MISSAQIRAGRALINAKQTELAAASGISLATLNNIERGLGDPRASTLRAIESALNLAGVEVDRDGSSETIILHKFSRPTAYDSFSASQRVLEILGSDSLIKITSLLFYIRRISGVVQREDEGHNHRLCLLINGKERHILFDQVGFNLTNSARIAEVAGVLLAALVTFPKNVYYCDQLLEDTTISPIEDVVKHLQSNKQHRFTDPKPLFSLVGDWKQDFEPSLHIDGHPLLDLLAFLVHINPVAEQTAS